jgi:hypothetical protein
MTDEDFEFLLTQYLDGTLSARDIAVVEQRLAVDTRAQAILEEYRKLSQAMSALPRVPEMRWDFLGEQISKAARAEPLPEKTQVISANTAPPMFSFKRPLAWVGAAAALAACALLAVGIPALISMHQGASNNNRLNGAGQLAVQQNLDQNNVSSADVIGPQVESSDGPAVAEVRIVPPATAMETSENFPRLAEGVVRQPSHVFIASMVNPGASPSPQ